MGVVCRRRPGANTINVYSSHTHAHEDVRGGSIVTAETHSFRVGHFDCLAIADGRFNYPVATFFSNAHSAEIEEVLRQHNLPVSHVATPYSCLYLDTGSRRVMIDTGAGELGTQAARFFPSVDHSTTVTGRLIGNLKAAGVEPEEIDTVIITHAHPDHIGGTLDAEGRLVFANARYYISETEWNFWYSAQAAEYAPAAFVEVARRYLDPVREKVTLVADDSEIIAGIRAIAAPGHTPGHLALSVASDGEQLIHISDTVLYPLHLEYPDWLPVFDMDPEAAALSKRRVFDRAAAERALVFAHHFPPFPSLGYVSRRKRGWVFTPIV